MKHIKINHGNKSLLFVFAIVGNFTELHIVIRPGAYLGVYVRFHTQGCNNAVGMQSELPHFGYGAFQLRGPARLEHLLVLLVRVFGQVALLLHLLFPVVVDIEYVVQILQDFLIRVQKCNLGVGIGILVLVVDALQTPGLIRALTYVPVVLC